MSVNSPRPGPEDPWGWSVDRVVKEFCRADNDRPTWCYTTDHLPNATALEHELRENNVTGEMMLTEVTKEILRADLNIKSMGQRFTMEKGIKYLRSISPMFQHSLSNKVMAPMLTPLQSWLHTSGPPYTPSHINGSLPSGVPHVQQYDSPLLDVQFDPQGSFNRPDLNVRSSVSHQLHHPSSSEPLRVETTLETKDNPGEAVIIDRVSPPLPTISQVDQPVKPRRRIAPTFLGHLDGKNRHIAPLVAEDGVTSSSMLMYGEAKEHECEAVGTQMDDEQPIATSQWHLASAAEYVSDSSKGQISYPNADENAKNQSGGHDRQPATDWFDELLAKYPAKPETEDLLALYGESGEEGEYDEETWQEIENDAAGDVISQPLGRDLSSSEVNLAIDEAVNGFKALWQESRLAKVQAKGFRLWKKANREGRVLGEIASAQYWIQRLRSSIKKIRQAILRETWSASSAVRHQCRSLEESIFQLQEHKYNMSILGSTTPPPRPDRKSVNRKMPISLDLAEGEVVLESESELSLSNFLDDETVEPLPVVSGPKVPEEVVQRRSPEGSDCVIPSSAKRRRKKLQSISVDPRKNPFIEMDSHTSTECSSSTASDPNDPPAAMSKSKYGDYGHARNKPIELLSSSDPSTPNNVGAPLNTDTVPLGDDSNDHQLSHLSTPIRIKLNLKSKSDGVAAFTDIEEIRKSSGDTIGDGSFRALAKAVRSLTTEDVRRIRDFMNADIQEKLQELLRRGFRVILKDHSNFEGSSSEIPLETAKPITLLFATYCLAKDMMGVHLDDTSEFKEVQGLIGSQDLPFQTALDTIFRGYKEGPQSEARKRKASQAGSKEGDNSCTSGSDAATKQKTPGKRRRRYVPQSRTAISSQLAGQKRVHEMEQRMATMDQKFQNIPQNKMDPAGYAIGTDEPVIYLDPKIGGRVKTHQLNGIRFMWRELMSDENKQGCLLAHTMGLGKTMQVISLLVTLAQSVRSSEAAIRKQIPQDLRNLKALILCPPSLIDNWYEEIIMWQPDRSVLGEIYKITQKSSRLERVCEIAQWVSTGGILIISYEMFRGLIVKKAQLELVAEGNSPSRVDEAAVEKHLLDEPNIIIADEAHKMKNTEAGISMVTSRFRSTRRIALTGSPLANNLDEYFAMIDWIAPGYLGTKEQFRSKYAIPISEGLWTDSEIADRRTSLRKLHVLKKNLDPKVSRADITAIADDLPSKTEFFITVPLTKMQRKAYNLYVAALLGGDETKTTGNARLWDWLAILSLLCNHPSAFLNKLDERQLGRGNKIGRTKTRKLPTTDDADDGGLPPDVEIADTGLPQALFEQQRKIFEAVEESGQLEHPKHSYRSLIVCDLVRRAVDAGDKILLFSHSIPTLNYLETMISSLGYSTRRLDGSTNVTKRQEAVKDFNKDTTTCNVFFISTRAGGLGLNLQGANRVILFDYGFNPIWEEQAVGRAYRLGQVKPVFVYRLRSGGTFEELIYNKAVFKTQLSARVVDKRNPMRHASRKATDYLFPVKEVPPQDLNPYYKKDPSVLDIVLAESSFVRDITLTETFQKEEDESLTADEVRQANEELKDEQEKRRDPVAYERNRVSLQTAALTHRHHLASPAAVLQDVAFRNLHPRYEPNRRLTMPPTAAEKDTSDISRPGAVNIIRIDDLNLHRALSSPHRSDLERSLGDPPARHIINTSHPSPTASTLPQNTQEAPGYPCGLDKHTFGKSNEANDHRSGIEHCEPQ